MGGKSYVDGKSGIYKITNIKNGKTYVGSAFNLIEREKQHFYELSKGTHFNKHLQAAWDMDGTESFKFEVVEWVDDKDIIYEREAYWIRELHAMWDAHGYNMIRDPRFRFVGVGETHLQAKLSEEDVRNIIRRLESGHTCRDIALDYNVYDSTISYIACGRTWVHLTGGNVKRGRSYARLNEDAVREIKQLLHDGHNPTEISTMYGVHPPTIHSIRDKKTWSHVSPDIDMWANGTRRGYKRMKLTIEDVRDIKQRLSVGQRVKEIASIYHVSRRTIGDIRNGHAWADADTLWNQ